MSSPIREVSPLPAEAIEVEVSEEAQARAHETFNRLVREQAAIDHSQDPGVKLMGWFREHGEELGYMTLALYAMQRMFLR